MINIDLTGKGALVCGSTQGIGKAIALCLAEAGASVTLLARNKTSLQNTLEELENKRSQKHRILVADFGKPAELEAIISNDIDDGASYHILINNTGGPAPGKAILAETYQYENAFAQHLVCNQILTKATVPFMKEEKFGRIINVISTSVKAPIPGLGVSNTIRGAVANWGKTLSVELAPFGITVNNILPGFTKTERLFDLIAGKAQEAGISVEKMTRKMEKSVPALRFGDPMEMGYLAAFLASPYASYINGVNIAADGGRTPCG
jgi:3-oxoacyl-[acyl-carrier protein] reductase